MKVYRSEEIRNIALVGHGGAGKTSLTEAILFNAGAINRMGKVDDGNTASDFTPEEVKRKITISTGVMACEYRGCKLNLLDTPGYSDFYFEVVAAAQAAESMLFVLPATAGVEVQAQVIWEDFPNLPKMVFINKMDREHADFNKTLASVKESFDGIVVPVQLPIGAEADFAGVVDLIKMKAFVYEGSNGKFTEQDIPENMQDDVAVQRMELIEAAAEADDDLLQKYLEGEELSDEEVLSGIKKAAAAGSAIFVFCGSAGQNVAIHNLMDFIMECSPAPEQNINYDTSDMENAPLAAQVFKTIVDPYIGRLSIMKVLKGKMKADSVVYNMNQEKDEKITQLLVLNGKEQQSVPEVFAGDITAVAKLANTSTSDTLGVKAETEIWPAIAFPEPTLSMAIEPKSKGDEDKLGGAIQRIKEEDPSILMEKNVETKQTIIKTMGETHTEIIKDKLNRKFGVEVISRDMIIPYRETIKNKVEVEGKHKKQSGGHGQYGHVWIRFEPNAEADFTFAEEVFGGSVPKNYFPAVEKGLQEALDEGVLGGYPVTNIKATLYDGSYHPVDSSEMAFKQAARLAFRKGMEAGSPVLLEPIVEVEIIIPDTYMGDIIGDITSKRGKVLGMEPAGNKQVVKAQVPLGEMTRYTIDLKSLTQGVGKFTMHVSHYEEVPAQDAAKIIEKARAEREEK